MRVTTEQAERILAALRDGSDLAVFPVADQKVPEDAGAHATWRNSLVEQFRSTIETELNA